MADRTDAGRSHVRCGAARPGPGDQLRSTAHRQRRVAHQDVGQLDHQRDVVEILQRVIVRSPLQQGRHGQRAARRHDQGVAVRRCCAPCFDTQRTRCASPVVDDDGLLQCLPQRRGGKAGNGVDRTGRCVGDDEPDGPHWIGGLRSHAAAGRQQGTGRQQRAPGQWGARLEQASPLLLDVVTAAVDRALRWSMLPEPRPGRHTRERRKHKRPRGSGRLWPAKIRCHVGCAGKI